MLERALQTMTRPAPAPRPQTREEWAELLQRRIDESGLSAVRFAREVLKRDDRTIRRWIGRDSPIPSEVQEFLLEPKKAPWP